jgi:squalene-hopene/tetraprenyl-beta-curcumene cyclase
MRRVLAALLCAMIVASSLLGTTGGASTGDAWGIHPIEGLPTERSDWWPDTTDLMTARESALTWFEDNQYPDGTWDADYGVNGLATFALLVGGRDAQHPAVAAALENLLAEAREDGSFSEGTYVHYYTSVAVMALSAAGRAEDGAIVSDAVDMLVRDQCDGDEEGFEEWWRGGIGYGGDGRPDMSNTQFALMALAAAEEAYPSIEVPRSTWAGAITFCYRSQNLPDVNDLDWVDDDSHQSFADGGFIYYPGRSNAGGYTSYGSMTAAGLWSYLAAGEDTDSAAAGAALNWLGTRFSVTENPGFDDAAYYYYAWALARALRTAGAPALRSYEGTVIHWAKDLATELITRQQADGRWTNTGSSSYWEDNPIVATTFAVLAIEAMMPAEGAGLHIRAGDDAQVRITDAQGRRDAEIPQWSQETDGTIVLGDSSSGPFSIEVEGSDSVELASSVGNTIRVWREVGLSTDGSRLTLDVAPLLGPASLVVGTVATLPQANPDPGTTPGPGVFLALAAVVTLAAVSAIVTRARVDQRR